ncbi:DUF2975 domain-containing protein [Caulobacter sp. D4A]|uniref:DUF2975 domain-containing protein n=1 Tax=unclassified Caulobacter TaxID=2648921 RepID=UPI000D7348B6|nr:MULTISPECIES: DUF2975 domain-containing protein [unclassified Caulobacter]PXA84897.1 DUF2975 domain-containing protein [Caulobacter sp. D4A]PXA89399.1 DUF2975 domain-containing protein [Caulobacter sp. D5]
MRALGPGSVSSFLKIILDVSYYVLWIWVSLLALVTILVLLLSFNTDLLTSILPSELAEPLAKNGPGSAAALAGWALMSGGWMAIVERLRKIFATMTLGDPFHPENVRRLRVVGGILAALEVGRYVFAALTRVLIDGEKVVDGSFTLNAWFSVLVVFVLAEVFREGARLRREAELTI